MGRPGWPERPCGDVDDILSLGDPVLRQGWVDPRQLGLDFMLESLELVYTGQPVATLKGTVSSFQGG